jgi:GH24 family phage-related lysozyme (muramidase)
VNRDLLKADLRIAEGERTVVYDDATGEPIRKGSVIKGYPTLSVGVRVDLPVSAAVMDLLLEDRIDAACAALDQELPWWSECTEPQQRALVELVFSVGAHGLLQFAHFLVHLRTGKKSAAGCELAASKWAEQVGPARAQRVVQQVQA